MRVQVFNIVEQATKQIQLSGPEYQKNEHN